MERWKETEHQCLLRVNWVHTNRFGLDFVTRYRQYQPHENKKLEANQMGDKKLIFSNMTVFNFCIIF